MNPLNIKASSLPKRIDFSFMTLFLIFEIYYYNTYPLPFRKFTHLYLHSSQKKDVELSSWV